VIGVAVVFAGLTMQRVGQWSSVESLARSSLRHYPNAPNVIFELGLTLGSQGRHEDAQKEFERSLALQENRPQVWTAYALSLVAQSKDAQAVDAWRRALALSPPDLGVLWRGLGDSALRSGQVDEAVRALTRARELLPQDPEIPILLANGMLRLGQGRLAAGRPDEAVDLALRATQAADLPAEGLLLAGLVVHRAGEPEKAEPLFKAAIAKDDGILGKRFRAAIDLDAKNEFAQAADLFREILVVRPDHVPTLFNLGRTLIRAGRPAEAVGYLEAGLDLKPDPGARALLAEAQRQVLRQAP
jgi:tetratricopeptide (TPR) repeat protein